MNDLNKTATGSIAATGTQTVAAYLKTLWQELLRVPSINPEDNFFSMGGDSMLVIEMLVAVSAHYDREFEYNKFFSRPDIATLSSVIGENLKTGV